eukprot:642661-Rhodomonas_salina.3
MTIGEHRLLFAREHCSLFPSADVLFPSVDNRGTSVAASSVDDQGASVVVSKCRFRVLTIGNIGGCKQVLTIGEERCRGKLRRFHLLLREVSASPPLPSLLSLRCVR